ncbi:hypothetical protein AAFF_G00000650 [Aldrovandia affinis]|uniref:Uncharacterized protein n=1 Tax=Aldrovandia affinis TaxID=143900 RepID=A0AAD7TE66_9TELE|nr:hypothetical protein AAFF_G00000650 [Aldrovandia affinis]
MLQQSAVSHRSPVHKQLCQHHPSPAASCLLPCQPQGSPATPVPAVTSPRQPPVPPVTAVLTVASCGKCARRSLATSASGDSGPSKCESPECSPPDAAYVAGRI